MWFQNAPEDQNAGQAQKIQKSSVQISQYFQLSGVKIITQFSCIRKENLVIFKVDRYFIVSEEKYAKKQHSLLNSMIRWNLSLHCYNFQQSEVNHGNHQTKGWRNQQRKFSSILGADWSSNCISNQMWLVNNLWYLIISDRKQINLFHLFLEHLTFVTFIPKRCT